MDQILREVERLLHAVQKMLVVPVFRRAQVIFVLRSQFMHVVAKCIGIVKHVHNEGLQFSGFS